ncbi:protein Tob1-like [Musca domestica]|uniref:BTG family n=1 Tax=Musca domestica TaxID=7370 RepID=T1PCS4_MUSDO|nr:protein Tob1 [Musca domestica]XP_019892946.1 protein Tob1 [Musca domestica]XP_019892947.1 protein Tob1 [Musca domestica]XP_058979012.1 protein Tob1 [Musca domestica]XP_058979013.1 protein Tob1 [Musca domestica]XP_058983161.1 protein Tob1-like [Musca domestica]
MHIEIQVALNFVISYLYNKLPRRRVNIFGEELEKALKDKFQGHWYPEKPVKGSAFRCLKTGDPIDSVLERAARESGVPITDILENLPNELSVWVDPGEVSYRIGEKGAVKILYSENSDNQEDNSSADGEVNKTFNPEAQCFRPIDAVNSSMNSLSLSPKTSPMAGSSPLSATSNSPTYKGSPNPVTAPGVNNVGFMQRSQAPLTFTTATFAQTKFGSTKLKTNSKRSNNTSYRMSPTEFSNYIKQRAMQQQQIHHGGHGHSPNGVGGPGQPGNHFGPIGPVSPARSLSPNPLSLGMAQNGGDPFYFPSMAMGMYPQFNNHHRNLFDATHFHGADSNGLFAPTNNGVGHGKFNNYLEPHGFYNIGGNHHMAQQQQQQHQQPQSPIAMNGGVGGAHHSLGNMKASNIAENIAKDSAAGSNNSNSNTNNNAANITVTVTNGANESTAVSPVPPASSANAAVTAANTERQNAANAVVAAVAAVNNSTSQQDSSSSSNSSNASANSKLIDGLNSFYSNATGSYQQLLVAN